MSTATVSPRVAAQHELHITRVFDAPRELVWKVWTDPEHMKHWCGPRQFTATHVENDGRPGGRWRLCLHSDGFDTGDGVLRKLDLCQGGENREVVAPERLVYTFQWDESTGLGSHETVVTVTFEDAGEKTRITMRMVFASAEARDENVREYGSIEGGKQTLERLAEHLSARLSAKTNGGMR